MCIPATPRICKQVFGLSEANMGLWDMEEQCSPKGQVLGLATCRVMMPLTLTVLENGKHQLRTSCPFLVAGGGCFFCGVEGRFLLEWVDFVWGDGNYFWVREDFFWVGKGCILTGGGDLWRRCQ